MVPTDAFTPVFLNAHYPSIERGLTSDAIACRALGAQAHTVCTSHVVASHGKVTDVLHVPADTIGAQLEHIFEHTEPNAAKIGIMGNAATVEVIFKHLQDFEGPVILDVTLSGPSGEDIIGQDGIDAIGQHLEHVDLVTARLQDGQLLAGMEIPSLDDAQVAVQRIAHNGARTVLLRCGQIATHHFDTETPGPEFAVDLLYDGDEFSLFEAPLQDVAGIHGSSSALLVPLLKSLGEGKSLQKATQHAKGLVTEALRHARKTPNILAPSYFWKWQPQMESSTPTT